MKSLLSAIFLLAPTVSPAAVLANYTFNDSSTTVANPNSSDTDGLTSASTFTANNGGPVGGGAGISSSTDMAFFRSDGLTTTTGDAVTNGDYFQFTISPIGGASMTLTSVTLDFGGSNSGTGGASFTTFGVIRSNAEAVDYTTDLGSFSKTITADSTDNQLTGQTVNLSGSDFLNLTTPVTFRIYVYSSANTVSNQIARLDNVVLNGTSVPEATSAMLAVVGLAAAGLRRRR